MINAIVPVADDLALGGMIQATVLDIPDAYDLADLQALAEQVPGMPARIRAARLGQLRRLAQRFRALRPEAKAEALHDYPQRVQKALRDARAITCNEAVRSGEVPEIRVISRDLASNQILRGFWEDLFARMAGTQGVNQTLEVKYLALGTSYAQTVFTQGDLTNETFRKVPEEVTEDGVSTLYATLLTKRTEYNPAQTTVSSATSNSITLASPTGVLVGARLQIDTEDASYRATVSTLVGSVATLTDIIGGDLTESSSSFPDDDVPVLGNDVFVLVAEGGAVIGEDASGTLGSGKTMNRRRLETKKQGFALLWDFIFKGASIDV